MSITSQHPFDVYQPGDKVGWELINSHFIFHLRQRGLYLFKVHYGQWEVYRLNAPHKRAQAFFANVKALSKAMEHLQAGQFEAAAEYGDMLTLKQAVFDEVEPSMIRLVNIKAYPQAPYDFYIGRANKALALGESKWHNPFVLKHERDRPAILQQYREHVLASPALLAALPELTGKRLGCYCYPKPCHGNVLIDLHTEFVLPHALPSSPAG